MKICAQDYGRGAFVLQATWFQITLAWIAAGLLKNLIYSYREGTTRFRNIRTMEKIFPTTAEFLFFWKTITTAKMTVPLFLKG